MNFVHSNQLLRSCPVVLEELVELVELLRSRCSKPEPVVWAILSRPESRSDPIGGSEPVSGTRDSGLGLFTCFFFVFFKPNWYLWVWPTLIIIQNIIYINRVPFSKTKLYFSNYKSERGPTCSEPFQVCWPAVCGCLLMSSPVPTRIKNPC